MKQVYLYKQTASKVRQQRSRSGFTGKFIAGLATLLTLTGPSAASTLPRSDSNALRGDFVRIGNDMKIAIAKERKREQTASRRKNK